MIKVIVMVAIFGLLVFLNPKNFFNPIRFVFAKIAYPFQVASYSVSYKIGGIKDFFVSIGQLNSENGRLMRENLDLISENSRLRDMEKENIFLREQIGLIPREKFNLEAATIISEDPQGFENWIEINKGSNSGIKEGMAVIVSRGVLIGKIQEVFPSFSKVILLSNAKSAVSVVVSQTGAKGVAKGEYGLGMIVDAILQTDAVSVGNEIITSGIASDMPRGLLLGIVQEVRPSEDHLFQQAIVASPVNVSKLDTVFIIKGNK